MAKFSIKYSNGRYVVTSDGRKVAGPYRHHGKAAAIKAKLEREALLQKRPCIKCSKIFASEGPHHRMCNTCRTCSGSVHDISVSASAYALLG